MPVLAGAVRQFLLKHLDISFGERTFTLFFDPLETRACDAENALEGALTIIAIDFAGGTAFLDAR